MAAQNMNGRLHLTDVHQNSPASFQYFPDGRQGSKKAKSSTQRTCPTYRFFLDFLKFYITYNLLAPLIY